MQPDLDLCWAQISESTFSHVAAHMSNVLASILPFYAPYPSNLFFWGWFNEINRKVSLINSEVLITAITGTASCIQHPGPQFTP